MATIDLGKIKFRWRGAYNASTAYVVDDVVESAGTSYVCILASTGNTPPNATYWEVMSQKGTDADLINISGTVQGDIYYNNGSAIARLGAGTSGQFLKTLGTGANPAWADAGGGLQSIQTFTSSGTYTKPSGINRLKVIVTGGGGGGGGGNPGYNARGGGGAGGTAIKVIDATSITTETVTIGAAGTAGSGTGSGDGGNGQAGGTSSFGSHCSATGGYGGSTGQNPTTFTRGVGSSGDLNLTGGDGTQYEGGGSSTDEGGSTSGGSSYWGGGGMGDGGGGNNAGGVGQAFGSGGGGGQHNGTGSSAGGAGKAGIVYIEEYK